MSIKELFNQNRKDEKINKKIMELEKSYLKINTLELHVKRLLKLEEKLYSIQKIKEELMETAKGIGADKGSSSTEKIEKLIQSKINEIAKTDVNRTDQLNEKVKLLEAAIAGMKKKIAHQDKVNEIVLERIETIQEKMNSFSFVSNENTHIHEEKNQSYNETELLLFQKLELIEQKISDFQVENTKVKGPADTPVVIKEIHIDKFYLDKYEQNNNIAQVGIKELSGALNIGATFGKDTIPKEMNEQLKEYFDEVISMKSDKKAFEKETSSDEQNEEVNPTEGEESFSAIEIEEENDEI